MTIRNEIMLHREEYWIKAFQPEFGATWAFGIYCNERTAWYNLEYCKSVCNVIPRERQTTMRLSLLCAITFIHHNIPSTTSCCYHHAFLAPHRSSSPLHIIVRLRLDILAQPSDTLTVTLPHDNTAHEDLNRPDALKRHFALSSGLVESESSTELVLRDSVGVVDLVAKNDEGCVLELVHGEQGVEFGLGFGETLVVLCINEEDNAADFGDYLEMLITRLIS